jgi:hypothetical protein
LIILADADKPRTAEDIDKIICAEIPDQNRFPQLYNTVIKSMNHGYCGILNSNSSCMLDGKCTKNYPKAFAENTSILNDGYPIYRRRDNGITFIDGRGNICDNRHIVPYNPVLSSIFDAHINVEYCASIRSIKYVYKYVYKGKYK